MGTDLKQVLERSLANLGVRRGLKEMMAMLAWPTIVGPELAKRTSPRQVQGGILFVATAGPAWSQQLSLMRPTLLERLNNHLGERIVTDIRFSVGLGGRAATETAAAHGPDGQPEADVAVSPAVTEAAELAPEEFRDLMLRLGQAQSRIAAHRANVAAPLCRVCGQPTGGDDLCPVCRGDETRERRLQVRAALAQNPSLSWTDAADAIPGLGALEYRAEHDDLLVNLWNILSRARDAGDPSSIRQAATRYLACKLSRPPAAVPAEEIETLSRPPIGRPRSDAVDRP